VWSRERTPGKIMTGVKRCTLFLQSRCGFA
jgi:hypothetical protein